MRRFLYTLPLLLVLALTGAAAAAGPSAAHTTASGCVSRQPVKLSFVRGAAGTTGTLRWKAGRGTPAHARYRVLRNGAVVGQTLGRSMKVRISLGHRYRLTVVLVNGGSVVSCAKRTLKVSTSSVAPSVPQFLQAKVTSATTATISWQRSTRGNAAVTGYRVWRDGAVYGQTHTTSMSVKVSSGRVYTFVVAAIARDGSLSARSQSVKVQANHTPPSTPQSLTAGSVTGTAVTLSWEASEGEGNIAYRVLRNGAPIGQYSGTSAQISNLTPSTTYSYSVEAVDSLGYVSGATAAVSVHTAAPGAPSDPTDLLGAPLNDTSVELSWQPAVPAQGTIVGYRVLRNGVSVGQFSSTTATIGNLAASTTYTFTVIAEDSLGNMSDSNAQVTVTTANPTPTSGHVTAFLLADTDESFSDFEAHYQQIGTIAPTYYSCNGSTTMSGANVPLITQWAQARQVKVLPRFNCQNTTVLDQVLNSPTMSQQWMNYIVGQVTSNNYDGAMVDFEDGTPADRPALTAFVTALAAQLHADGKLLYLAVSAKTADVPNNPRSTFYDYNALSAQADALFVMAWGIHWSTSAPGAQDDMTWVQGVVNYISTLPRVNKYILGMQLYAMDWANGGGLSNPAATYEYQPAMALAASLGVTPTYNPTSDAYTFSYTDSSGAQHVVWFTNSQTEGDRITLAHNAGFGGVGVWRLGEEDQNLWSNPLLNGAW